MKAEPLPAPDRDTLAQAIVRISDGFQRLQSSGLNLNAIVALLHDSTSVGKREIRCVLAGLGELKKNYCG